jgi:hypothetical protein
MGGWVNSIIMRIITSKLSYSFLGGILEGEEVEVELLEKVSHTKCEKCLLNCRIDPERVYSKIERSTRRQK